jgi:hypothetical protein
MMNENIVEMDTYSISEYSNHRDSNLTESQFVLDNGYSICHTTKRWLHIFDFDDTLFPSTWLIYYASGGKTIEVLSDDKLELSTNLDVEIRHKLYEIETSILSLLNTSVNWGRVYILTAATYQWISYIMYNFLPRLLPLIFDKIKVYSARERYPHSHFSEYKILSTIDIIYTEYRGDVLEIIGLGDKMSDFDSIKSACIACVCRDTKSLTLRYRALGSYSDILREDTIGLHFLKVEEFPTIDLLLYQIQYADEVYLKSIYTL